MVTIRDYQFALQEKIKDLKERDAIIKDLRGEIAGKNFRIKRLEKEIVKLSTPASGEPGGPAAGGGRPLAPGSKVWTEEYAKECSKLLRNSILELAGTANALQIDRKMSLNNIDFTAGASRKESTASLR